LRSPGQDVRRGGWAELPAARTAALWTNITGFIGQTLVIVELEMRKLRHDPTALVTRSFGPLLWLLVFGQVFTRTRAIPTGNLSYTAFLAPGIIVQTVLFSAMLYGTAIIWDRDLGIVHKFMASPMPRTAFVLGKSLAAGVRCLPPVCVIYVVALFLGVRVVLNPLAIAGVFAAVVLGAGLFSALAISLACVVKTRERFMGFLNS